MKLNLKSKYWIVCAFAFLMITNACQTINLTEMDHPVMMGPKLSQNVNADSRPIITEKWVWSGAEASTTSNTRTITTTSSVTRGIWPILEVSRDNDVIVHGSDLYVDWTLFVFSGSEEKGFYGYFRQ